MTDPLAGLREYVAELVRAEVEKLKAAPADDYLTVNAAAAFASVAPGTVRRWVREGELQNYRAGRTIRVKRNELERLLKSGSSRKRPPADETPEALALRKFG
jgi:excisionase family DNA binding protein